MMSVNTTNTGILEDDQQLYDWGIENRLDQYTYQVGDYVEGIYLDLNEAEHVQTKYR